jgi:hypothetical protein
MSENYSENDSRIPIWVILSPITWNELKQTAFAALHNQDPYIEDDERLWGFVEGKGVYSALIDYDPIYSGGDISLVEAISKTIPGDHFVIIYMPDDQIILKYRDGKIVKEQIASPSEITEKLQCNIPGLPSTKEGITITSSVCIVQDATPEQVAKSLGLVQPPTAGPLHINQSGKNVLVYSEKGNAAIFTREISKKMSSRVYLLCSRYGGNEFSCTIFEKGEDTGIYEYPSYITERVPQLTSVADHDDPAGIIQALGVPLNLLGIVE